MMTQCADFGEKLFPSPNVEPVWFTPAATPYVDPVTGRTNPYPKPPYSYASLIGKAILDSKDQRARLNSIYNWIAVNFPFYQLDTGGWQNSIRHNLTVNQCFIKDPREDDPPGKGSFWKNGIFEKPRGQSLMPLLDGAPMRKSRSLSTSDLEAARAARRQVTQSRPRRKSSAQQRQKQRFMSDEDLYSAAMAMPEDMYDSELTDIGSLGPSRSSSAFFTVFGTNPAMMDGMTLLQPPLDYTPSPYDEMMQDDSPVDFVPLPSLHFPASLPNSMESVYSSFQPWAMQDYQRNFTAHQPLIFPEMADATMPTGGSQTPVDEAFVFNAFHPSAAADETSDPTGFSTSHDADWAGECAGWIHL